MSSSILHESSSTLYVQHVTRFVVQTGREAVAALISKKVTDLGWSYGEIVRRSGGHIKSASTLVNIVNGNVQRVSEETLLGLAHAFTVSDEYIFNLYRGKSLEPMSPKDFYSALEALGVEQFQAYGGVANLSDEDRAEIVGVLTALIEQKLKRKQNAPKSRGAGKK
jgi:transcriptional regulator with XRE-family HTH domain